MMGYPVPFSADYKETAKDEESGFAFGTLTLSAMKQ